MKVTAVVPSYEPDEKLIQVVDGLLAEGFDAIVVVNDGSHEGHLQPFAEAAERPGVTVLRHEVNKGKGRGLKTAFEYILDELPEVEGVITIDGDGQHLLEDIIRCGNRMLELDDKVILGCRDFDQPGVPSRNAAGNKTTSKFFKLLFDITLSDTQTGLRAIPTRYLRDFCAIDGERFEYETNMLLQMKRMGVGFVEQPIATVYDPEDYSSHYHPVKDSWRIIKIMLHFLTKKQ